MALHLYVSNSLEELTQRLCLDLQTQNGSVFQPNVIVTQTEGMNSWLKLQLASQLGIAANYRFIKPNNIIQQVFIILGGKYQQSLSPENQCWFLYRLLGEDEFINAFPEISEYYTQGEGDKVLKRLALAEKIADLFDQYQVYRPEMIRGWNQGVKKGWDHEDWQMYLWVKAQGLSAGSLPDKTHVADHIHSSLKDPENQRLLKSVLPHVQLAGMSVLTDFHMDLFSIIGQYIELSFYILNPAPSMFWYEDKSKKQVVFLKKMKAFEPDEESIGNALLTSWGGVLQNTFNLLFKNEALVNAYDQIGVHEPVEDSLLHKIQADLFHNRSDEDRTSLSLHDLQDGSLEIHSCYTPVREVEALYNYLVQLIDQRGEALSARDIVVMVSDIDAYAPYIKAIFQNAPYSFPFTIADESYSANDTISAALLSILNMNKQRFKAEELMQLLDSSYIRRRFGLTDLALIRKVVDQANFRFGMDGSEEDDSLFVSWRYALKRILFGICMSGGEEFMVEHEILYPLDLLEGNESLEIIRFCHFMEVLIHSIEERSGIRNLSEWVSYVEKTLNNLVFDAAEEEDEDYWVLMNDLLQYNGLSSLNTEKIPYQLFNHSLQQTLGHRVRSGSFATSGITFCSMIPMRSIPFKVVAILGLTYDKFPRKENKVSFNLIDLEKRMGDRNVKENDKNLFLETLLSAKQFLYLSYLGQSVKDNTSIPPSALVDELLDYIQAVSGEIKVNEELITRHALHGFSGKYQQGDPKLYSYFNRRERSALDFRSPKKESTMDFGEISIDSLIRFLKHPIKAYYNHALSIYYTEENVLLSETELFSLDRLQQWKLKELTLALDLPDQEQLRNKLLRTGGVPLRNMATITLANLEEEVAPVRELFLQCIGSAEEKSVPIDLTFEEERIHLKGTINRVFDRKLMVVSWSKNETKYLLEAYIKFLCIRASGIDLDVYLVSAEKGQVFQSGQLDPVSAKERLSELVNLFQEGHSTMQPFIPNFKILPKDLNNLTMETFKKRIDSLFKNPKVVMNDNYLLNKYKEGYFDLEEVFERYIAIAEKLLLPLEELFVEYYQK